MYHDRLGSFRSIHCPSCIHPLLYTHTTTTCYLPQRYVSRGVHTTMSGLLGAIPILPDMSSLLGNAVRDHYLDRVVLPVASLLENAVRDHHLDRVILPVFHSGQGCTQCGRGGEECANADTRRSRTRHNTEPRSIALHTWQPSTVRPRWMLNLLDTSRGE